MDLYYFGLPLSVLVIFGICSSSANLLNATSYGVKGKDVAMKAAVNPAVQVMMVTWTFSSKSDSASVYNAMNEKETFGAGYENRVSYNRSTYTLVLKNLVATDSGTYLLTVFDTNMVSTTGQTLLTVLETVSDVTISSNITDAVEINSTVVLTCTAQGSVLTFKWFNDTNPVLADGKHVVVNDNKLTINEVFRTDLQKSIYCEAGSQLESKKSPPFNMTVFSGPENVKLTRVPNNTVLKLGSNLTLSCSASSNPAAELKLLLNGVEFPEKTNPLTISKLKEEHSGNISCLASNSKTKRFVSSEVVTLSVVEAISGTSITGPTFPLIAGNSTCQLTCKSSTGKANQVEWLKNGKALAASPTMTVSNDKGNITFSPVQKDDAGEYKCLLSNRINNDSAIFKMAVNYGPDKVEIKAPKLVEVGKTSTLNCSVSSVPDPTFVWKLNNTVLAAANTSMYILEKPSFTNSGIYSCEAFNLVTGIKKNATYNLSVKGEGESAGLSSGAIAGIVIAVLLALVILFLCIRCRRKKSTDIPSPY